MQSFGRLVVLLALAICGTAPAAGAAAEVKPQGGWVRLFNGRDLTGWTAKIKGYDPGDNHKHTFRVEDGIRKVELRKLEE